MQDYYAQQAEIYERLYQKAERSADIAELRKRLMNALENKKVLELACGTGYWTACYAPAASTVVATDINEAMLNVAKQKEYAEADVAFALADGFAPPLGDYDACFAGFWWSQVKKEQQADFLTKLGRSLKPNSLLVLIDDCHVEGVTLPIARTDKEGNTYQLRTREDGSRVEILQNFPTDSYLRKKFAAFARDIRIHRNDYYWMLTCILK